MSIKQQLEKLMKERGMTVRELSEKSKVPKPTIYALLKRDSSSVTHRTAEKLAEALECTPADIYGFNEFQRERYEPILAALIKTQHELKEMLSDPDNYDTVIDNTIEDGPTEVSVFIPNIEYEKLSRIEAEADGALHDFLEDEGIPTGLANPFAAIINYYSDLNEDGQLELMKRAEELTQLPKYRKNK